jgi:2-polyprenyl-6-hydroxyphenyl methylase/3-demethylubiquinone-9 3-methyltransferase
MKERGAKQTGRILDLGCGTGQLASLMRSAGFQDIDGVDWTDPASVAPGILSSYRQVDLNEHALEDQIDGKYDLIVCSETLEHLERPAKVLRTMRQLLNDTGSIYITLPNCANILQRISWLLTGNSYRYRTEKPGEFGHISLFPSQVLTSLLNRAGLECVGKGRGYAAVAGFITDKGIKLGDLWSYVCYYQLKPVRPR